MDRRGKRSTKSGGERYRCPICYEKTFTTTFNVDRHMAVDHGLVWECGATVPRRAHTSEVDYYRRHQRHNLDDVRRSDNRGRGRSTRRYIYDRVDDNHSRDTGRRSSVRDNESRRDRVDVRSDETVTADNCSSLTADARMGRREKREVTTTHHIDVRSMDAEQATLTVAATTVTTVEQVNHNSELSNVLTEDWEKELLLWGREIFGFEDTIVEGIPDNESSRQDGGENERNGATTVATRTLNTPVITVSDTEDEIDGATAAQNRAATGERQVGDGEVAGSDAAVSENLTMNYQADGSRLVQIVGNQQTNSGGPPATMLVGGRQVENLLTTVRNPPTAVNTSGLNQSAAMGIEPTRSTDDRQTCPNCCVEFSSTVYWAIHMDMHDPGDPSRCQKCGRKCFDHTGLAVHLLRGDH